VDFHPNVYTRGLDQPEIVVVPLTVSHAAGAVTLTVGAVVSEVQPVVAVTLK
jgi:hypothetical protein